MDFFGQQDSARRRSRGLVLLFILAVIGIILAVFVAITVISGMFSNAVVKQPGAALLPFQLDIFIAVALGTLALILGGSAHKILQLREGGHTVAHSLGGRPISPDTTDVEERRLLNVVEEMAIASGVPVPPVYLLEREEGINAFAAGSSMEDAVIGVTAGCLQHLTRDELQALIAHQFSHVLNGDMRFNLRMIGILHGILLLGIIGYFLMRIAFRTHYRSRRDDDGKLRAVIIVLGISLVVIGYVGLFFGRVIKARISRQRKWLSDAATVQFTRNPDSLASLLRKIDELPEHGHLTCPNAEEASHLYFANGIRTAGIYATHPPIAERIKRLDPANATTPAEIRERVSATAAAAKSTAPGSAAAGARPAVNPMLMLGPAFLQHVGNPAPEHVAYATAALRRLPEDLRDAAHCDHGARALVFLLLIGQHPESRRAGLLAHVVTENPALADALGKYAETVGTLPAELRLPLLEVLIPALRNLNEDQFDAFRHQIDRLVAEDDDLDLFEFCVRRIVVQTIDAHLHGPPDLSDLIESREDLTPDAALLLGFLAAVGHDDEPEATRAALDAAATEWPGLPTQLPGETGLAQADAALDRLRRASPANKKALLAAALACISSDQRVTVEEAELFRAIAETLGCPVPPVVPCAAA